MNQQDPITPPDGSTLPPPVGSGQGLPPIPDGSTATDPVKPAIHEPQLPETIGSYRIIRLIGVGGMGAVYEAEQSKPKRTVALKVIRPGLVSERILRRFAFEAEVLGRLQHAGIAQIYEAGLAETTAGTQPYFAMELVRGLPLREYVAQLNLTPRQKLDLMARIPDPDTTP